MALRILPFGSFSGFSDVNRPGSSYYTQGFTQSLMGAGTMYSIQNKIDSGTVTGMGNIKYFALGPGGAMFAQDDAGNILKETTAGAYDFAIVRSPGGNGAGLVGDQYGNLLYANGATNTQLGKYDGSTWTDNYQSLTAWQHPMDTSEDLRLIANKSQVAVLYSDASFNASVFTLPSSLQIAAIKGGPTGILIGANYGYRGAIILWDGNALRAKTSWKWVKGQILSIDIYGENWIVKTQREVFLTNGYTIKQLFGVLDDPLSFKNYEGANLPQQMVVVNDMVVFLNTKHATAYSYEFGRMKPGVYLYHLSTHTWDYLPLPTGNQIGCDVNAVFVDANYQNRILIGYRDNFLGKNYIAALTNTPPTRATWISETLGIGRPHYQRTFFGPTDKIAEAAVINLNTLSSLVDPATLSFNLTLKLYDFKRQLWGAQLTNANLGSSHKNQLQVDGTSSTYAKAKVGDEVTVLEGVNAGQIAHITTIANGGASNETWTLDTTFGNATETNVRLSVQPWKFIEKKTFSSLAQLKNIFFNTGNSLKAKQFLLKLVFDGIGTNLGLEINTSYFIFDDIGYDQT